MSEDERTAIFDAFRYGIFHRSKPLKLRTGKRATGSYFVLLAASACAGPVVSSACAVS
jgi:hypothetical protein